MHFCRFLFKLVNRMEEIAVDGVETLKELFASLILTKITNLSTL